MQSASGKALYTGVTNNLDRRVREHKAGSGSVFTAKYKCHKLVYYEDFGLIDQAIVREKEIKSLSRVEKERLIDPINPERKDLFEQSMLVSLPCHSASLLCHSNEGKWVGGNL